MKHFIDINTTSKKDLLHILALAQSIKAEMRSGKQRTELRKKVIGLLFQKPSTRTRVSFEVGITQLGGRAITLHNDEVGLGKR